MPIVLNKEQEEAANHLDGPCLVVACPGSGKTAMLTERVVRLIDKGIDPSNIMCLTFTNKAAKEMKDRITYSVGTDNANKSFIGTFHSFCAKFLRHAGSLVGLQPSYTILDSNDQIDLLKQIARSKGIDVKEDKINLRKIANQMNSCREKRIDQDQMVNYFEDSVDWDIAKSYFKELINQNVIDFSGLIYETINILEKYDNILSNIRRKYKYIQIDETQDTNFAQFHLIGLLGGSDANIMLVADINQSIYRFRNARYENITDFISQHPNCIQLMLPLNYRSTPDIIDKAEKLIKHNSNHMIDKILTNNSKGMPVEIKYYYSPHEEAEFIAGRIRELKEEEEWEYSDMAVFYRANAMSREFETSFSIHGIPYTIIGGRSFYDRKEIRDCIAMLNFANNLNNRMAFARCTDMISGIGAKTVGEIELYAQKEGINLLDACKNIINVTTKKSIINASKKIIDIFSSTIDGKGAGTVLSHFVSAFKYEEYLEKWSKTSEEFQSRKENITELINSAIIFEQKQSRDLSDYLQNISLITSSDKNSDHTVSLMTIHASKGLEFPIVFIVGVEENIMPHGMAICEAGDDLEKLQDAVEEETRICYVGMTRAMKRLYMSYCKTRPFRRGKYVNAKKCSPSRFLYWAGFRKQDIMGY